MIVKGKPPADTVVAVLETMWGDREGHAPRYFRINPFNRSGKRLYKLIGAENASRLVVTNACPQLVCNPRHHGKPDPKWLAGNLARLAPTLVLVCGRVARRTFRESGYKPNGRVLYIPHPAARSWTKAQLLAVKRRIKKAIGSKPRARSVHPCTGSL